MRLLLDTHAFLWAISDDGRLGTESRQLVFEQAEAVFLSHVSLWEIAIKRAHGRLQAPDGLADVLGASGIETLPVTGRDAERAATLPHHHRTCLRAGRPDRHCCHRRTSD